jgi:hypothetical protein
MCYTFSCLLLFKAGGPSFPLAGKVANSTPPFLSLTNPALMGISTGSKTPAASNITWVNGHGQLYPNSCQNRRIHMSYRHTLKNLPEGISIFLHKIIVASEKF